MRLHLDREWGEMMREAPEHFDPLARHLREIV